jgi:RNA polymerase sigma factor (sigma-70 family)
MGDAELVAAALPDPSGRPASNDAFAAIYDRYVDRIYDYARSVVRSDADAADIAQDTFLAASQRLDQLRDPSKLRPWLYAIARSHAFRIIRERKRTQVSDDVDEVVEMTTPDGGMDAAGLVWAAAAGLEASDRDILDLHLRQGLDGQELADALGVTNNVANVALHRVRSRLEQSVGAVLLAKTSHGECAELDALMTDGLNPLARKRLSRHVKQCTICADRQSSMTSPTALFAATPLALAPMLLRDQFIASLGTSGAVQAANSLEWRTDGFPTPEPIAVPAAQPARSAGRSSTGGRQRFNPAAIASSAAVVLLGVVGIFLLLQRDTPGDERLGSPTIEPAVSVAEQTDTKATASPEPTPATTVPVGTILGPQPATTLQSPPNATVAPPSIAPSTVAPSTAATTTVPPQSPSTVNTVAEFPPQTTVAGDLSPDTPPVVTLIDFTCGGTMEVTVNVDPASPITGTFEWEFGANGDNTPLVADPVVIGRFSAELTIGEGSVDPQVVVTGPGGTTSLGLDTCIVID